MRTPRRLAILLLAAYLLGLHAIVIIVVSRTDIVAQVKARLGLSPGNVFSIDSRAYRSALELFERIDQMLQQSPIVFAGDSIVQSLPGFHDLPRSLNLAVGGSSAQDIERMLSRYRNLGETAGIVLGIGINDLCFEHVSLSELGLRLNKLSAALPSVVRVVWSSILPVDPDAPHSVCTVRSSTIREANALIAEVCAARKACTYSDGFSSLADANGRLSSEFHAGDGLHLSQRGYEVWSQLLRHDLGESGATSR